MNIILEEHHGGRRAHSTATANSVIKEAASRSIVNNKLGVIISTDLTAVFDMVDHNILVQKLHYYGVKEKTFRTNKVIPDKSKTIY